MDATGHTVVELTVARLHIRNHCGTVEVYHDGYYIGTEMFVWVEFQHIQSTPMMRTWMTTGAAIFELFIGQKLVTDGIQCIIEQYTQQNQVRQ